MPGYVVHMAAGCEIIKANKDKGIEFANRFLQGNLIPDAMPREEKKDSHFWDDKTYKNLNRIPNLDIFLEQYGNKMSDPFVLGYYTHLYLDNLFVKEYWSEHFELLNNDMKEDNSFYQVCNIRLKKSGEIYSRDEFFSEELYYGDYDRMNPYLLEKYSIICPDMDVSIIPITQINGNEAIPVLNEIAKKIRILCHNPHNMIKQPLKVFELECIYSLIDKVVSNVCDII